MLHNQPDNSAAVSVWLWDNSVYLDQTEMLFKTLNADERARRDRQYSRAKGLHWGIARAKVRQELAKISGLSPADLTFQENEFGHLKLEQADLSFSVSHDGAWTALAVCDSAPIGVDIESVKPLTREEMDWPLSPRERTDLAKVDDADLLQAFFRYWTLKEAFIKALGLGVSFPLEDFDISSFGTEPALLRVAGEPDAPSEWCFAAREIRPDLRFALALKTKGIPPKFSYYEKMEWR